RSAQSLTRRGFIPRASAAHDSRRVARTASNPVLPVFAGGAGVTEMAVNPSVATERAVRTPRSFDGAVLLSGATVASGILAYAYHVLAARVLGPEAYGLVAVLWAALFLLVVVLFRPLEQTTSRALADRLARVHEVRS